MSHWSRFLTRPTVPGLSSDRKTLYDRDVAPAAAQYQSGNARFFGRCLPPRYQWRLYQWLRPLVVGIVHGLAGSAAVALLVLAAVHDPTWAIAYLLLLGVGTVAGMMLITVALAAPFAFSWSRLPRFNWQLRVASGLISLGFGLLLIYEIGFSPGGLFTANPNWRPY